MKKVTELISTLRAYFVKNEIKGIYYGYSGGVDSAVLDMVIRSTSVVFACPVVFSFDGKTIPINCVHARDSQMVDLSYVAQNIGINDKIAVHNIQYQTMYSKLFEFAQVSSAIQKRTYITAGSCNKTELLTGWYGTNSDMMVDILPLLNLSKAEIYEAAQYLGVPKSIIDAEPDGNIPSGETDEQALGANYELLDQFAHSVETTGLDAAMICLDDASRSMKLYAHLKKNERKIRRGCAMLKINQFKL